jgi:hypothetical protein
MRTTITLDDDVAAIAMRYAQSRELSLSEAIADLIVRATQKRPRIKYVDGLPVFDLPKSRHSITSQNVKELEAGTADNADPLSNESLAGGLGTEISGLFAKARIDPDIPELHGRTVRRSKFE